MADARTWAIVFRTLSVIFTLFVALSGAAYFVADRSAARSAERGRRLSASQVASLTERLKIGHKPNCPVTFGRAAGAGDMEDVGQQLVSALENAGFRVDHNVWPGAMLGSDPVGILVRQKSKDAPVGTQVAAAFESVGLATKLAEYGAPGTLEIYVGRPP